MKVKTRKGLYTKIENELTYFCYIGQDLHTVKVVCEYITNDYAIDFDKWSEYIKSLSGKQATHEEIAIQIYEKMKEAIEPAKIKISVSSAVKTSLYCATVEIGEI